MTLLNKPITNIFLDIPPFAACNTGCNKHYGISACAKSDVYRYSKLVQFYTKWYLCLLLWTSCVILFNMHVSYAFPKAPFSTDYKMQKHKIKQPRMCSLQRTTINNRSLSSAIRKYLKQMSKQHLLKAPS